ncbi:MAG: RHS repeat-associated core domain-containing protein [Coriobacteriia bacterium]|nr:RHS repeat-associated core domain-containing protein [Coriobacteriia bacterium]
MLSIVQLPGGLHPYIYSPTTGKKVRDDFDFSYPDRSEDTTYTYGATNRLTSATRNNTTTNYSYDATSGALSAYKRGVESTQTLAYDQNGRITRAASTYFEHDALGRRITQAPSTDFEKDPLRVTYSWSGERLITQSGTGWSASHVYDATGQRTRSVVTSGSLQTTTTWAYEGIRLTDLDAVRSDTATWSLEYLYDERGTITGGIYSAEDTSCAFLVVATDRGDVRELLDANGDAFAFYSYDAYGNPDETLSRQTGKVSAALAANISQRNVLRYAGYCYDEVSGLYYLSQRYYDPVSASFVSKDPARADGEESAYQYCAGDPVGKVDPTGKRAGRPLWGAWLYRDDIAVLYGFWNKATWSAKVTWTSRTSYKVVVSYKAPARSYMWKGCRLSFWVNSKTATGGGSASWDKGGRGGISTARSATSLETAWKPTKKSMPFYGSVRRGRVEAVTIHARMSFDGVNMDDGDYTAFSYLTTASSHQSMLFTNSKGKAYACYSSRHSARSASRAAIEMKYGYDRYRSVMR